jgi:chromosome segregation ATPase
MFQARIASLQEQNSAVQAATSAANSEAEELRGALANMDVRLTDFHRKDTEVYSRIKEAMEQAEQAKLAREALEGRETMLKHEVSSSSFYFTSPVDELCRTTVVA